MPFFNPLPDDITLTIFNYLPINCYAKTASVSKSWRQLTQQAIVKKTGLNIEELKTNHDELVKKARENIKYAKFIIMFGLADQLTNKDLINIAKAHPELSFKFPKLMKKLTDTDLIQIVSVSKEAAQAVQAYPDLVNRVENYMLNNPSMSASAMAWMSKYIKYKSEILNIHEDHIKCRAFACLIKI